MKKILILASNPRKDLNLDREIRDLKKVIEISRDREDFEIVDELAVRVEDLQDLMLRHRPQIVHFCGHGGGEQGLVFENALGTEHLVQAEPLSNLFRLISMSANVECVLLNACYSTEQADAIVTYIDYVIGMNQAIRDDAAIAFSKGFYRALGYGYAIDQAYEFGCNSIQLEISGGSVVRGEASELQRKFVLVNSVTNTSIPEHLKPIFRRKQSLITTAAPNHSDEIQTLKRSDIRPFPDTDPRVKQFREQIGEYLVDHRLEPYEMDLLEAYRDELGISPEKAKEIVDEEIAPLEEAKQAYLTRLKALIKYYPFSESIKNEIKKFQTQKNLTDAEVQEISQPLLETAQIAYEKKLSQSAEVQAERESSEHDIVPPMIQPVSLDDFDGLVSLDSPFYIERPPIESNCYNTSLKPGALIRIKAPRQMGKSSLVQRILHHAHQQGYQTAYINFQIAESNVLTDLARFLKWFCYIVTDTLDKEDKTEEFWQKGITGAKDTCTNYFRRYLLKETPDPIILGLDEVDQVFQHLEIADGFFSLLRVWHEKSKNEELWKKLRLVLAHSKEVYIPLNINQSPFNVGLSIEPGEFNQSQVIDLVQRHKLNWSVSEIEQLMKMVDGHPYLLRKALYEIASGHLTLAQLLQLAPTDEGPYYDHLRRHLSNIKSDATLEQAFKEVITSDTPVRIDSTQAFRLRSMGLVNFQGNDVVPLCNLYKIYFCDQLKF